MPGRSHAQRRRRWFAAAACLLWLLGVEVLPGLHLGLHADDHTHGEDGTIHAAAHDQDRDHDHGPGARRDELRPRGEGGWSDRAGPVAALDDAPSAHAAAGLAHHAIALHRPPPPLLEPLPVLRAAWRLEHAPTRPLHDTQRARPNARGPPATI
jgi:hypothetical protein